MRIYALFSIIALLLSSIDAISQPIARCKPALISLERISASEFEKIVNPSLIDDSSYSNVGLATLTLSKSRFVYQPFAFLSDIGVNTVSLTATDINGDTAVCNTFITVLFPILPLPEAKGKNDTVYLNKDGIGYLVPEQVNDSSISYVGQLEYEVTKKDFSCEDVGIVIDTLIVTDPIGSDSTTVEVTVLDTIPPTVKCKDAVIELDKNGLFFLTPSMFDDGTTDACGIESLELSRQLVNCADIGVKEIWLIATDVNGNKDSCKANMLVVDFEEPEAICMNITVGLNSSGTVQITPQQISASIDNCGIELQSISASEFHCGHLGLNKVVLTVIDNSGNMNSCVADVKVENFIPPLAKCKDISIVYEGGTVKIGPDDINDGSVAFCGGIKSYEIDKNEFSCPNIGNNQVVLTVTDFSGLANTCTSNVAINKPSVIKGRLFNTTNSLGPQSTPVFTTNNFPLLEIDEESNIWAGSTGGGLYVYEQGLWHFASNPSPSGNSGFTVRALRREANGNIWAGMSKTQPCLGYLGKIYVYTDKNTLIKTFDSSQDPSQFTDLPSDVLRALDVNKSTNEIWAGCTPMICSPGNIGGLAYLPAGQNMFLQLNQGMPPASNLDRSVYAITSGPDNMVYIAVGKSCDATCTAPYIIIRNASGTGGFLGTYTGANTPQLPLNSNSSNLALRALFVDSKNRLWVGGELNGIAVKDGSTWTFLPPGSIPYPNGAIINFDAIYEDKSGYIYFGTSNGFLRFNGENVTDSCNWNHFTLNAADVPNAGSGLQNIGSIRKDEKGYFWIATRAGIFYQREAAVVDVRASLFNKSLMKKPLQGVLVQAYNGNTPVGSLVTTNPSGDFVPALESDPQLEQGETYTLRFFYSKNPLDRFDEDLEFFVEDFELGMPMKDIQMPVSLLKQIRVQMDKMSPEPPSEPLKYDFKVLDYAITDLLFGDEFLDKDVFSMTEIKNVINPLDPIEYNEAVTTTENLGRVWLSLKLHESILDNKYEIIKLTPQLITIITDLFVQAKDLKETFEEKKPEKKKEKTPEEKEQEEFEKRLKKIEKIAQYWLDKKIAEAKDPETKKDFENYKEQISKLSSAFKLAGTDFNLIRNDKEKQKQIKEMYFKEIKTIALKTLIIARYKLYCYALQDKIDALADLISSGTTTGDFSAAVDTYTNQKAELDEYVDNIKNRLDLSDEVIESSDKLFNISEKFKKSKINEGIQNAGLEKAAQQNPSSTFTKARLGLKKGVKKLLLAIDVAESIWKGGWLVFGIEEIIRGELTIQYRQRIANDLMFNPSTTTPAIIPTQQLAGNNFLSVTTTSSADVTDFIEKLAKNDSLAGEIIQDVSTGADSLVYINNNLWNTKGNELEEIFFKINQRFIAASSVADSVVSNYDSLRAQLEIAYMDHLIKGLRFDLGVTKWLSDTSQTGLADSLGFVLDTMEMANDYLEMAILQMDNAVSGLSIGAKVLIDGISSPDIIQNNTSSQIIVTLSNYGTLSADSVVIRASTDSLFSCTPDSIFISSINAGDSISIGFTVTAATPDTSVAFIVKVDIKNKPADLETVTLRSDQVCTIRYFEDGDLDGYGSVDFISLLCEPTPGFVLDSTDCNDNDNKIFPGANESCNLIDDNCNSQVDENALITFYRDEDGDGFGNSLDTIKACQPLEGYVPSGNDCADTNALVFPTANERCNLLDDNCNSLVDENVLSRFYLDNDGDGFGNKNQFITACFKIEGYVEDSLDCNDVRADIFPGGVEKCNTLDDDCDGSIDEGCPGNVFYADQDNDTFGNRFQTITISGTVHPSGYVTDSTDCSDNNASINPLATETCNGKDDDCDGQTDESLLISFYRDIDQDGFGDSSLVVQACIAPAGFVPTPGDCNNTVPTINPGASEVPCNFIDDNCNGVIDEGAQLTFYRDLDGDGFGNLSDPIAACSPPSGYVVPGTDCNDAASSVFPGALESCNLIDDNCDNSIDEGVQTTFHHDVDGDGFGNPLDSLPACSPPSGYVINKDDCNDNNPSISPLAGEICNTVDDDCDGQTDEGVQTVFFRDLDGDGFGNPANTSSACTIPAGFVSNSTDCNDNAVTVFPGGSETCNLIDDDCDTQVDEGVQTTFFRDQDGDGFGNPSSTTLACSVPAGFVSNNNDCNDNNNSIRPTAAETCNLIDDDCNAQIDEGVQTPFYRDADGDGFGNPNVIQPACSVPSGFVANDDDCNDARPNSFPGAQEQCNGIDDDCDGSIDEGVKIRFYRDLDQDGFGNQGAFLLSCSSSSGYVADSSDCNDNDSNIHPGADEICNGIDEDCDGVLDESCSGCAYVFNSTVNPAGCFGLSNGSAAISPSVPGLNYSWSNGLSGASVSGLAAGTYKVTISNNSGCIDSIFISIQQPSPINTALSVINVSCSGGFNGSIQSTVTGGAPPYNYLWSTTAIAPALSNLIAGSYTVTVTDLKGCTATATTNISEPAPILVNITGNPVSCFGGSNGSLTSSVSGGTEPYTWLWSNGSTSSSLTGLTSGTYSLTVKDASQCQTTSTLAVTQPTLLIATLTRTNVTCFGGSNGAITASVSGGFAPYTYIWSTGASTSSITGLNPGSYTVTITDKNGCSIMRSTTINQPQAVSVTLTPAAVSCAGGSNGSITSQVVGGTSPYSYSWSNGATTAHISNVTAGTYTLTVITGGGCTGSATATIVQPSPLSVTTTVTNVSCQGGNNGAITANATGGTSPYSYAWSNGSTAASISGLQAGTYTVTVTSSGGCTATSSNTVIQPAPVPVSISASGPTTICSGSSVVLTASAGSAYLWNTGSTNSSITVNIAGTYSVMVTNASGCTGSSSIAVTVTTGVVPAISITANPVGPVTASTQVLFNATVSNGGSAPAYQWKKNGVNTGSNSPIYTNNTWTNGDTVQCFLTSNALCATPNTVVSNKIIVAVNASGLPKFIVVDVTANRACYYDSLFNFLSSAVMSTNVLNGNTNATDVVATSTEVFVLDGVSRCIYRSTSAGTPATRSRTLLTNTGATLTSPTGLTVSGDTLWVLDKGRRSIYRYSISSAFTGNGNLNAVGRTTLVNANSAGESVWNDAGFLYVLNNGNTKNIFRYLKSSGTSTRSRNLLTNTGTALNTVTGLTFFNSLMWVADRGLDRVYSFPAGVLFSGTTALNASSNTPLNPINVNATGIATIGTTGLLRISEDALMDQVNVSTENVLRLVPNPSDNMVTLFYHINEAGTVLININDMAGKTVYSKQEIHTMPGRQSVDLFLRDHGLSPGAYIISCTGKTDIISARFMLVW